MVQISINNSTDKYMFIHTVEYQTALRINDLQFFTVMWRSQNVILSKRSHTESAYCLGCI